jgi:hypothetical protein
MARGALSWALVATVGALGCDGGPVVPKPIGHTGLPLGDDDDTTPVPASDDDGSVVLTIQNPSALDPAGSTSFTALFVESDRGWVNLVECFTWFCASQLPAGPGDSVLVNGIDTTLRDDLVSRDVGEEVTLGPATARKQEDGRFVYYSTVETRALDFGSRPIGLSFGGEWPEYAGVDDIVPPTPMVATQPSTTEVFELFSSDLVHLEWEPGTRGEVYLLVTTPVERRLYQLEDTGSHDLDLRGLGLPDDAPVTLDLGRWSQGGVDAGGNVATLFVKSNQRFEAVWKNIGSRRPLTDVYDTCDEARSGVPLQPGNYQGDIRAFANDLRPRENVCTPFTANGQDGVVPLDLLDNDQVDVSYRLPQGDASVYLTADCADLQECVAGSDATFAGGTESFSYVNDRGDRRVYLVLDGFEAFASDFTLDVTVTSLGGSVFQPTCADAIAQGAVASGTYQGRIGGNQNLLTPDCSPNATGGEGIAQVFLLPGQTLEATVTTNGSPNAALYLLYNCSIADSCLPVAPSKRLTYQNQTGTSESLYLVLDGPVGLDPYVLDLLVY